jgi:hypothetical protein
VRKLQKSPESIKLPELKGLPDSVEQDFKCDAYIEAATAIQALGPKRGLIALAKFSADSPDRTMPVDMRLIILCRMLFVKRPFPGEFRRPGIGAPVFLGGTTHDDWPLEPIELVDGVPFLITMGYSLAGLPESAERYLAYCMANCDWNSFQFQPKTHSEKAVALSRLLGSGKWKRPLHNYEEEFFTDQVK